MGKVEMLRKLEGRRVRVALTDGSRLDDVVLVSCGRGPVSSLWLEVDGVDVFVQRLQITDARAA